ncbi:TonB-dependent receptor domain-containing protein [Phaeobacter gallaeciensis]|uniref:Outer membrane receptor protein, mostly Fe transport n=1 Tax=Phaeobacter gallaeciensis TaxID=60890 RepID=A0AAC9ZE96_9RHOB|nr:TonB-dependent receptor [Phaeobacter gallaeciensis]AHD11551.1 Outer membrane receptor protein, mostly Fe transport [Phaeobacter gallaeciensis DSM 26640]ATE94815.1 Outer membrane receptor protein, mostly Fe transport [Phaeobacter gallaeciensis]ATE99087.1 Outer membrane receptor protein, mostly Fe transport [Phaeobacter gallaeciensis]ATF03479.1 Outer membrane receptor protein, mostly Fe transport [Phaeobacter gallaeciensis]ATF07859.1 Outer membrane receptor protein, mostly Fe transport [Phaeo
MSRMPLRFIMLAGTTLSTPFFATGALGQEEDILLLDEIRIEAADAQALLGNDTITEDEIESRNPSSTKDVFAGESAVTAGGGAAISQKVFVNGIEESLLSVTIDGARQNKSAFHHTGNVLLDPELLKSVEISKGLAPADAGPGALAGSIAYETKDASDLLEDGDNFGGRAQLGTSSNGTDLESSLTLFGRQGGFEYLLSGTRRSGGDYEDGDGNPVLGTQADLTDYVGKLAYESQSGHRFEFAASQTEDNGLRAAQAGPGGILFIRPDFAGITSGPSVLAEGLSRRTSYTLTYSNTQPQGIWDPVLQLSHNEQEIDAIGIYGTNKSFSGTFKNKFSIAGGSVTAGLDFFNETAEGQGRGPGPFASSGREELESVGLFAQARQDIGERVSVSYGARYDKQEFTGAEGSNFSDGGFSANGSVDVILSDNWTLNAGLASSWGGYELGEAALVNFGTAWDYSGFTTSRANAGRIGVRFDNGTWKASAALFRTDVNDIAAVLPTNGARGATADLKSQGIDASLEYDWAAGFARMNWTYADVELNGAAVGSTAYYLGRPMGHVIALEGGFAIDEQWSVGGTAQIALKNSDTATELPGYEVVNVYAAYAPRNLGNLEIRLDVRNLFDETYASRSSDGIDSSRVIALNEPGRTIGLTARLKF